MNGLDLPNRTGPWLTSMGPMHDVVISSRVRLARNLAGMPFLSRCTEPQQKQIASQLREEILSAQLAEKLFYLDVADLGELDRQLLVERHLISRQHADANHPRGVAVSGDETVAVMVNEEDHLRIQVLRGGLQLNEAFEECNRIDDLLEQQVEFAYSGRFGYLTACPTNAGTGLRLSVMLHLPALKLTGEIERAFRAARDMHLAIRGLYGEGTEAMGDFFQVSNQVTLGVSSEQIVEAFLGQYVPQFLDYERGARKALETNSALKIDDKIFRARAVLQSARSISSSEGMYLLSLLRLGVNLGRVEDIGLQGVHELFLRIQPAHLQSDHGEALSDAQRDEMRATLLRERLAKGGR